MRQVLSHAHKYPVRVCVMRAHKYFVWRASVCTRAYAKYEDMKAQNPVLYPVRVCVRIVYACVYLYLRAHEYCVWCAFVCTRAYVKYEDMLSQLQCHIHCVYVCVLCMRAYKYCVLRESVCKRAQGK